MAEPKMVKCRVCGTDVSDHAPACPKCGDATARRYGNERKSFSPWKIIGWIVLIFLIFVVYACSQIAANMKPRASSPSESSVPAPQHQLEMLSFVCDANYGRTRADITVRNIGSTTMEFTKAFISFDGSIEDSYFTPHDIPPGVIAKADVYSPGGGGCQLTSIQDRDGVQASIKDSTKQK